jgi:hypothetical protein
MSLPRHIEGDQQLTKCELSGIFDCTVKAIDYHIQKPGAGLTYFVNGGERGKRKYLARQVIPFLNCRLRHVPEWVRQWSIQWQRFDVRTRGWSAGGQR